MTSSIPTNSLLTSSASIAQSLVSSTVSGIYALNKTNMKGLNSDIDTFALLDSLAELYTKAKKVVMKNRKCINDSRDRISKQKKL